MGLAVGLAWIIIGVVYVAYKFLTEELHHSSFEACVRLCLLIVGIVVIGSILMTISESDVGLFLIQSIVGIAACIFLFSVVKWETESYRDSIKEEQLPSEITKENVRDQARRVQQYRDGKPN